jgi:hypothetical protein
MSSEMRGRAMVLTRQRHFMIYRLVKPLDKPIPGSTGHRALDTLAEGRCTTVPAARPDYQLRVGGRRKGRKGWGNAKPAAMSNPPAGGPRGHYRKEHERVRASRHRAFTPKEGSCPDYPILRE